MIFYRFDRIGSRFDLDPFIVDHREVLNRSPRQVVVDKLLPRDLAIGSGPREHEQPCDGRS